MGLTGPLVYIEGAKNVSGQIIVFTGNTVSWIHTYAITGVLHILKYFYGDTYNPSAPP